MRGSSKPMVVEATHAEKPLTTVFQSGSLIHHRYRTPHNLARSCLIIAFHLEEDHPGQLIPPEHLEGLTEQGSLLGFLFGQQSSYGKIPFGGSKIRIGNYWENTGPATLRNGCCRSHQTWRLPVTRGISRTMEESLNNCSHSWRAKDRGQPHSPGRKALFSKTCRIGWKDDVRQDCPLDLILYHDSHEEIRKWARNQIREKKSDDVNERLVVHWMPQVEQPSKDHLLTPEQIKELTEQLAAVVEELQALNAPIVLRECEKITHVNAYRSVRQLMLDLGESITRCENCQAFLSTSLFIYWACDMLMGLLVSHDSHIQVIGNKLLANYLSTTILFEKYTKKD